MAKQHKEFCCMCKKSCIFAILNTKSTLTPLFAIYLYFMRLNRNTAGFLIVNIVHIIRMPLINNCLENKHNFYETVW